MFEGKTAIVAGGSSGIGQAIAAALVKRGTHVVIASRGEDRVRAAVAALSAVSVEGRVLDVRDRSGFKRLAMDVTRRRGSIDFLFNCAGMAVIGELRDHTEEDIDALIDTNLRGAFNGVSAVYPQMIEQGSGHIINVSSVGGFVPTPFGAAYTATKFGVVGLSQALRLEAQRHGVNVSVVCPAVVSTPMGMRAIYRHIDREGFLASTPGPSDTPEHCAKSILRGVERRRGVILPHVAGVLGFLHRYLPWFTLLMMRKLERTCSELRAGYQTEPTARGVNRQLSESE